MQKPHFKMQEHWRLAEEERYDEEIAVNGRGVVKRLAEIVIIKISLLL